MIGEYFSDSYAQAAERFRSVAVATGARLDQLPLRTLSPDGERLAVDIAWLGNRQPRRVLLHSSGLHGVEGFAGSAIQLRLLREKTLALPQDGALILMHIINPYGMAWLRRTNENNVDLNRNFRGQDDAAAGAPREYHALDSFINPRTPPGPDFFYLRALLRVLRHGFPTLQRAIATGQYVYPQGLFYGGTQTEQGPALLESWVCENLHSAEAVLGIDVHTGLGRRGRQTLFLETRQGGSDPNRLQAALGFPLVTVDSTSRAGYANLGGYGCALSRWLAPRRVDVVTEEFGTRSAVRVLYALREENRWHFHGAGYGAHASKRRLKEAFYPTSSAWRRAVLEQGVAFATKAAAYLFGTTDIDKVERGLQSAIS